MPRRAVTKKDPCGCSARANPRRSRRNPDDLGHPGELQIEPARVTPGVPADLPTCLQWVRLEKVPAEYEACMASLGQIGKIQSAKDTFEALKSWYARQDQEVGVVLLIDVQLNVRGAAEVSRGERDSTVVPIPDILRVALVDGATGIIFCHNHPTGHSTPSDDDKTSTVALDEACEAVGLMLMDHVIFGADEYYSFADSGVLASEPVMPADPEPTPWVEPEREEPFVDEATENPVHFYYRGYNVNISSEDQYPAYSALMRIGFTKEQTSKAAVMKLLLQVSNELPIGAEVKIEKLYRAARGYEPNAKFSSGQSVEEETLRLAEHGSFYDPKTGKPKPAKWTRVARSKRESSVHPWVAFEGGASEALVEDRSSGARRGWEHRRERDEWVVQNLEPHLIPLWIRLKDSFRGTPEERYIAFLQYVHDHPGEETAALQGDADAWLEAEIAAGRARENPRGLSLWKLNGRTGYWDHQRSVTAETADEWLRIFRRDEPEATFVVSKNRPTPPALRGSRENPLDRLGSPIVVGDHVTATWTWGGREYRGAGALARVNEKSVKVRLTTDAGDHFRPGFVVTTTPDRTDRVQ